jgi:endonuclease VIII-like 1
MPEHAEIKISSEFFNKVAVKKTFNKISKSEKSKVKTDITVLNDKEFTIKSITQGKEMKLIFITKKVLEVREMIINFGMSGTFLYVNKNAPERAKEKALKHSHLRFHDTDGGILAFYDVRRFGKWHWVESGAWGKGRGVDPIQEFQTFKERIYKYKNTHKSFKKPIHEVLLNQTWFNGVGNYLRAEILYRIPNLNPFTIANEITDANWELILDTTKQCCTDAFYLQGGYEIGTGNKSVNNMEGWHKVYGQKSASWVTINGRRFWFDSKWNSAITETHKKRKYSLFGEKDI